MCVCVSVCVCECVCVHVCVCVFGGNVQLSHLLDIKILDNRCCD